MKEELLGLRSVSSFYSTQKQIMMVMEKKEEDDDEDDDGDFWEKLGLAPIKRAKVGSL